MDLKVRSSDGQGQSRKPRSGADVDHPLGRWGGRDEQVNDGAVEHVTVPQSRRLARTDEPATDPRISKDAYEVLCLLHVRAEDDAGL